MRRYILFPRVFMFWSLLALASFALADPQLVDVAAQVHLVLASPAKGAQHRNVPSVVIWLRPLSPEQNTAQTQSPVAHYRMVQKNKQFNPQFLVVPLGSTVEFPNLDPFFHNVFSQFNGKRFDLGLYETGSSKGVRFDHEGVSYIFCNIHPEMAAVIVTLSTPYFSVTSSSGTVVLHRVPVGNYEMHVWAEGADIKELEALTRHVSIGPLETDLGPIQIVANGTMAPHKNKFGEDYRPEQQVY
jgi:plastocyanin